MRALRLLILTLAASGLLVAGAADAAQAKRRPSCARGGRTVAQNGVVRVYQVALEGVDDRRALYACTRKTRRRAKVVEAYDDQFVSSESYRSVRVAGRFVAFADTAYDSSCKSECPPGYDPYTNSIGVFDTKSRKSRYVSGKPAGEALVLTVDGAVAWAEGSGDAVLIRASDSAGTRTLDSGTIDPKTLGVELTIVSWTRAGEERFARLR